MEKRNFLSLSIACVSVMLALAWAYTAGLYAERTPRTPIGSASAEIQRVTDNSEAGGVVLPVQWGDLGIRMIAADVIDIQEFEELYADRGGLSEMEQELLTATKRQSIVMNAQNAGTLLNLLWAFGLANANPILENGPMTDPQYGGAGRFASTGGWTLAKGDPMSHYSAHTFVSLTPDEQERVERVSRNIYRPCCGNSTYFPDCNHGMAMLGLLELMAAQGMDEEEMYRIALQVNAYWFPDMYRTIAAYFRERDIDWQRVDAQVILGSAYSSAQGYSRIMQEVETHEPQNGGSCGV